MMRSIVCGQRRHPPPKSPSQVLRLVVYFRVILQFKCIMWLERMLQKNSIPRLVVVDMLERLIRQSCTPDVERSEEIVIIMLAQTCIGKVYASDKGSEG